MAAYPLQSAATWISSGIGAQSHGKTVTPNASANVKGNYLTIITAAENTQGSSGLLLHASAIGAFTDYLIDLSMGVGVSDLLLSTSSFSRTTPFFLPVEIPNNTAVAVRCQAGQASAGGLHVNASLVNLNTGYDPPTRVTSYGPNTSDSGAVSVDPGAVADTPGSWTTLSTAIEPIDYLLVVVGNQQVTRTISAANWMLDIGIGAAGSEQVILSSLALKYAKGTEQVLSPVTFGPYAMGHIFDDRRSGGSMRLAARLSCSSTSSTDRKLDVAAYGFGGTA